MCQFLFLEGRNIKDEREVVEEHRHAIPKSIFLFPESLSSHTFSLQFNFLYSCIPTFLSHPVSGMQGRRDP